MSRQSATDGRVEKIAGEAIDRTKPVVFDFEGKRINAFEGDTVASALYAAGVRILSRSFKYHRPRGLLCVSGQCPNCMVNVDGEPNVRSCSVKAKEGMKVHRQNAWPSADTDLYSMIQSIDSFLPVGFYYKTFINWPIEWKRVEGRIRKITGVGSIEQTLERWRQNPDSVEGGFEQQFLHAQVAVVGGGPAGIAAAFEASNLAATVVLIDDQPELGGHLRFCDDKVSLPAGVEEEYNGQSGFEVARRLSESLSGRSNVTVLRGAVAFGLYESNLMGVMQDHKLIRLRAEQIIVATGSHEYPTVFQNNDLPGVFLGRGLQKLVRLYGVRPGNRVLIVSNNDAGLSVARSLMAAKIPIAGYVDGRKTVPSLGADLLESLKKQDVPVLLGHVVKELHGGKGVNAAVLVAIGDDAGGAGGGGQPIAGSERTIACDAVSLDTGFESEASLLNQAGYGTAYDSLLEDFIPSAPKASILPCGEVTGLHDLGLSLMQGRIAGLTASLDVIDPERESGEPRLMHARSRIETLGVRTKELEKTYRDALSSMRVPSIVSLGGGPNDGATGRRFVCVCEDVAEKDIAQAVSEGFEDIETLKRYSTATMGPCQGKMCSIPSIAVCARQTGRTVAETGRTVSRPPYHSTPMGVIAGVEFHPVKLTPMHYKHAQLDPKWMDMGEWKRPHVYTSVEEEYKAVRERVGIIDVSTLGRLDVRGADAPKLLDFVYTHIFSTLKPGKSRYGVICDDAGVILDDGTVTRLSENHYFITTTTGNVDFVEQWLTWWATAMRWDAQVTNVTAGLAGVNVAGPRARDLLRKLTDLDLSTEAFPYMNGAEGLIAGVPCILLRIGFVGETGWEIHFPAEFGEYFWDKLFEAGKEYDVKPFGVEAQRILRLEKKHVIVSQDTDALSSPYEADMGWVVKLEKPDFVGKAALQLLQKDPGTRRLVGIVMEDSTVAHDGDQAFSPDGKTLIGVVTSSRFSPQAGKGIGLALVSVSNAKQDERIAVRSAEGLHIAKVTFTPFYDPEGKRLKS